MEGALNECSLLAGSGGRTRCRGSERASMSLNGAPSQGHATTRPTWCRLNRPTGGFPSNILRAPPRKCRLMGTFNGDLDDLDLEEHGRYVNRLRAATYGPRHPNRDIRTDQPDHPRVCNTLARPTVALIRFVRLLRGWQFPPPPLAECFRHAHAGDLQICLHFLARAGEIGGTIISAGSCGQRSFLERYRTPR